MLDWLKNWVETNPKKAVALASVISAGTGNALPPWVSQAITIILGG